MTRPVPKVDMRKEAFIGRLFGAAARGIGGVGAGIGKKALGVIQTGATENPLGFGMATLGAATTLPFAMQNPLKDPMYLANRASLGASVANVNPRTTAAVTGWSPEMAMAGGPMKLSSSVLSQEDLDASVRISGQLEKIAATPWGPKQLAGAALAVAGAGTLATAAQQLGSGVVGRISERAHARKQGQRFAAMLKADPSLKDEPLARTYFGVLDRASPYIGSEPTIAAATVHSMLETPSLKGNLPGVTSKMVQDILKTEESRQATRFPLLQQKGAKGPELKPDVGSFSLGG